MVDGEVGREAWRIERVERVLAVEQKRVGGFAGGGPGSLKAGLVTGDGKHNERIY